MHCLVKAHPAFAKVPLSALALPGSENAGTFNLDAQAFDNQSGSACTTINELGSVQATTAQRFSATQDQSITRQLDEGVRWIDLKVGYNGGGNPIAGWRVTQNLYSNWPLSEYLDEVANWAALHPAEAIVVDLSTICYDHDPTAAVNSGLWANFATKSAEGAGSLTLADVAVHKSLGNSLATVSLGALEHVRQNVVVLIPASAKGARLLRSKYHIDPVLTSDSPSHGKGVLRVKRSDPRVAPTSPSAFPAANAELGSFPTHATPPFGSLKGKGFYVSKLAYELKGASSADQHKIFTTFVGLVTSQGLFRAWSSGLWSGAYEQIVSQWASATNVVIADGVDQGGFAAAVIARNGR
jgi:hypothetical protein